VDFIIKHDKKARFRLAALQDEKSREILKKFQINGQDLDSVILLQDGKIYRKSRAALEISRKLNWPWPLLYPLVLVPFLLRDPLYDWVARNRYRWFGKKETCRLPSTVEKERFL
jgi:predicted DCC family thiol-disulfide oxidoreductase YuxK